jgi:transcriptional regulator with XRE-family HTH domain
MRHSSRPQPGLGIAIRQLREKKRQTQETLADQAGIAVPTLSHIEAGHANPTWATVKDIAAALGVSISELAKLSEKHEKAFRRRPAKCD